MHTHENVLANVETAIRVGDVDRGMGRDYRTLVVVPLFHVTGCHSQMLPTLSLGGTTVIDAGFDGARMIETLARERITGCVAVPAIYYYILNHPDFSSEKVAAVRWASYGGAPIAPALVHQIKDRFGHARVGNGFGLTECTSIATFLPHEWAAEHADSVGFAAPHAEVAVVGVPDSMMGEKVGAVIVPLPGAHVDPRAVIDYARERLADFKVPQYMAVREEPLPRNPSGKILKSRLRKTNLGPELRQS